MMKTRFTTGDVSKILGVGRRRVINWVELDLTKPLQDAEGSGTRRLFTFENLVEIGVIAVLSEIGIGTRRIKIVLDILKRHRRNKIFLRIREELDASNLNNLKAEDFKNEDFEPKTISIYYKKKGEITVGIPEFNIDMKKESEKVAILWKPINDKAMIVLNLAQIIEKIKKAIR